MIAVPLISFQGIRPNPIGTLSPQWPGTTPQSAIQARSGPSRTLSVRQRSVLGLLVLSVERTL